MIAPDVALRIARARAERHGYELVLPGDPRREAVLYGLAAAHALTGSGWDLAYAREHVGVALPGVGSAALGLLAAIPYVGPLLAGAAATVERPQVYLSPVALRDGAVLLVQILHEEGHVGDIRRGGPLWCLCYGAIGEVRAGAEAPCYVADLAVRARLGEDPRALHDGALAALRGYGLGPGGEALAAGVLRSGLESVLAGGDPGGLGAEVSAELERVTAVPS